MTSRKQLDWLSALRGVAALAVVITHARRVFLDTPMWETANSLFLPFAAGVDLFFVISGFLMFYTTFHQSGSLAARTFARKRFLRIWPAYFVISLLAMIATGGLAFFTQIEQLRQFLLSIVFLPVNGDALFSGQSLGVGWTINYEAYFYVVFGLSLLAGAFRWWAIAAWFMFSLIILPLALGAPSLVNPLLNYNVDVYPLSYLRIVTNPIIWEFVGGIFAGYLFIYSGTIKNRKLATILSVSAILFAIWNTYYFYYYVSLSIGAGFTVLVAALAVASKTVDFRVPKFLKRMGETSYTLYLVHFMIIEFARVSIFPPPENAIIGAVEMITIIIVCLWAAERISPIIEVQLPRYIERAYFGIANQFTRDAPDKQMKTSPYD